MTDTESKEVEELTEFLGTVFNPAGEYTYPRYVASRLIHEGYTKRPQDNKLLPHLSTVSNIIARHRKEDDHSMSADRCTSAAEEICAKFGKDNSGMVPLDKEETINFLSVVLQTAWIKYKNFFGEQPHGTQKQLLAMLEFCIEEICAKFSQQPPKEQIGIVGKKASGILSQIERPKERKVSLEEIRQTIRQHGGWESSIDDISKAILSLINATEEREGE